MNAKLTTAFAVGLVVAATAQAHAQDADAQPIREQSRSYFAQRVAAPVKALELSVGTGYTQGFGMLQGNARMQDVITPGIAIDLGIAYRISPHWAVGITGQYQEFDAQRATSARGLTTGLAASYHFMPYTRTDPWIQLGTGYRFLWENQNAPASSVLSHGFELAKLTVGVDIRVHQDVAIAPVIGADLTLPLWQDGVSPTVINDPRVSTFVFAGLQGRFDLMGKRVNEPQLAKAAPPPSQPEVAKLPPEEVTPVSPSIAVSKDVLDLCDLNLGDIDKAPKFEFDMSALLPADEDVLRQIAECFTTGPLKDATIHLVGRADPRGTFAYNDALGGRRANNVATFLIRHGVADRQTERTSRGKRDALGTDETSWAIDRRVDITLAAPAERPDLATRR